MSTGGQTSTIRLLVADDNHDVRFLIRTLAGRDGVEVVAEATDGHEAIEQARLHRPQVVLLDVDMPGLDGVGAIPGILGSCPDTRIVMYSSYEGRRSEAISAGAHGWLKKGTGWDRIKQTIDDVL